jgi:NADH-quinone oxidoreductase subunit C
VNGASGIATRERIRAALEGLTCELSDATGAPDASPAHKGPRDGMPTIEVARESLRDVLERLKTRAGFEQNTFVTAVDLYPREPRFEVVHQFLSFEHKDRARVRTLLRGDDAWVPTCTDLWPGASFAERECWDLFGIRFEGHPDLRRLMMPELYGHHPLRKDFPHQGIEPDRLYREWDAARHVRLGRRP